MIRLLSNLMKLALFDANGISTGGLIYMSDDVEVFNRFSVKDGFVNELLRVSGVKTGIISGKTTTALINKFQKLDFDIVVTACKNKLTKSIFECNKLGDI